jgi:hypothetical protein
VRLALWRPLSCTRCGCMHVTHDSFMTGPFLPRRLACHAESNECTSRHSCFAKRKARAPAAAGPFSNSQRLTSVFTSVNDQLSTINHQPFAIFTFRHHRWRVSFNSHLDSCMRDSQHQLIRRHVCNDQRFFPCEQFSYGAADAPAAPTIGCLDLSWCGFPI